MKTGSKNLEEWKNGSKDGLWENGIRTGRRKPVIWKDGRWEGLTTNL